jgi:hypothetical protein
VNDVAARTASDAVPGGAIAVRLWLQAPAQGRARRKPLNTATGVIGSTTQNNLTLPTARRARRCIANPPTVTFPAGSAFRVAVTQTAPNNPGRNTLVYPVGATAGNFSRVVLNSATVIDVNSVQTFNAAYPGGAAQANFSSGSTAYVRAVVSDPFGSFDIASARISIVDLRPSCASRTRCC